MGGEKDLQQTEVLENTNRLNKEMLVSNIGTRRTTRSLLVFRWIVTLLF